MSLDDGHVTGYQLALSGRGAAECLTSTTTPLTDGITRRAGARRRRGRIRPTSAVNRLGGTTDRSCHDPACRSAVAVAYLTIEKKSLQGAGVSNAEKFGSQSRTRSQTSDVVASCLVNWASLPLDAIRRPRNTPIWKLEAALKCRSCKKGRAASSHD